jgi:hypothetical protein
MLRNHQDIPHCGLSSFMGVAVSAEFGKRIVSEIRSHDLFSTDLRQRTLLALGMDAKLWQLHQKISSSLAEFINLFVAQTGKCSWLGAGGLSYIV